MSTYVQSYFFNLYLFFMHAFMHYTAVRGEDYNSGPYYVTLPAGITHLSFNISILDDKMLEEDENFILTIDPSSLPCSVSVGNHNPATVTILEDECK